MAIVLRPVRGLEDIEYNMIILAQAMNHIHGSQVEPNTIGPEALTVDYMPVSGGAFNGAISAPEMSVGNEPVATDADIATLNVVLMEKAAAADVYSKEEADQIFAPLTQFMPAAGAELYESNNVGTSINIAFGGTYVQWITPTIGQEVGAVHVDGANDRIQVDTEGGGLYLVTVHVSFGGTASEKVSGAVFKNGAIQENMRFEHILDAAGAVVEAGVTGLVRLVDSDSLDLRFTTFSNTRVVTVYRCNLLAMRIAP